MQKRLFLALFMTSSLSACGGARPQAPSTPPPVSTLPLAARHVHVYFEGANGVDPKDLEKEILIDKEDAGDVGETNANILQTDLLKINAVYYDHGYFDVKIGTPEIEGPEVGDVVDIRIPITEGPQYRLGTLTIEERDDHGKILEPIGGPLRPRISIAPGDVVSRARLRDDLDKLKTIYHDAGYWNVEAEPESEITSPGNINITIPVKRHNALTLDQILVYGNRHNPMSKVREKLHINAGDLFSETKILATKAGLQELPGVADVVLRIDARAGNRAVLIFEVHEK